MKTEIKVTERVDTADHKFSIEVEDGEIIVRDLLNKDHPVVLSLPVVDGDFLAETMRAAIAAYAAHNAAKGGAA